MRTTLVSISLLAVFCSGCDNKPAARADGAPWEQQDKQYQQQLNKVDEQINKADEQIERLDKILDAWEKKGPSVKVPSDR